MEFDPTLDVVGNEIIKTLIEEHEPKAIRMKNLFETYKGNTPIKRRQFEDPNKLNNKLVNDYRGDIVDTVVGYMFGNPIVRDLDKNKYNEASYELVKSALDDFAIRNTLDDVDSEVGKMASICGYGVKLLYINQQGEEAVMSVKPWECIFVDETSRDVPQVALRYYYITDVKNNNKTYYVELYDKTTYTLYERDANNENYKVIEQHPHLFGDIPLIKYKNNDEEMGDFEKVDSLIDAYERVVSDVQNEAEELRLAYMLFYGLEPTTETLMKARQTGGFALQLDEKVEFLTKDINVDFIEKHKASLDENIYKFAKVPNMADENFAGNASGIALKYKLMGLESKGVTKERKFNAADRQLYKALQSALNAKGVPFNYLYTFNTWKRNLPVDIAAEVELASKLKGIVSDETLLGMLSIVDDVQYELELIKKQQPQAPQE